MNQNETMVAEFLARKGHHVIRRGWPDFLCVKREYNRIMKEYTGNFTGILAVEVKAGKDGLSDDQKIVHAVLKLAGIPTYVIRPEEVARGSYLATGRLKLWTVDEVSNIKSRLCRLEQAQRERQSEINELRALIDDCAVLFEETNFILEAGPNDPHGRRALEAERAS